MMMATKRAARTIGVLILLQSACGPLVNFGLLGALTKDPPGFLVAAAANAPQIGLAVLLGLAMGAFSIAIAIVAWPLFRRCSESMALWLFALSVAGFTLGAIEHTAVLSMLSLSKAYAGASATDGSAYHALAQVVASARTWAHYMNLIIASSVLSVFYGVLYLHRLVPRALAASGLASSLLLFVAIAMPIFGEHVVFLLLLPLGLSQLTLAFWLIVKGFGEPPPA